MAEDNSYGSSNQILFGETQLRKYGPLVVFISGLALLLVYSFAPSMVNVDLWTIGLLIILAVLPFVSDIKELAVTPDEGFRITKTTEELRTQVESSKEDALETLRRRIEDLEKEEEEEEVEREISSQIDKVRSHINTLAREQTPEIAFMELVQRLERELKNLLQKEGVQESDQYGIHEAIKLAEEHDILDKNLIIHLQDIRPLRNQVVHGQEVDSVEIKQMIELGLDLLETLLYDRETSNITEQAMLDAIHRNPDIIEKGFTLLEIEKRTDYGRIDLLGEDTDGNKVIVEVKSHEIDSTHLKQLIGLLETQKKAFGADVRGILVAPSVSSEIRELTNSRVSAREVNLRELHRRN